MSGRNSVRRLSRCYPFSGSQKLDPVKRCCINRNDSTAGPLFRFCCCHRPLHKSQLEIMQYVNGSVRLTRWFSSGNSRAKLFIGGLSYDTNETVLRDAFGKHGEILEVKVICDHVSSQSRGYGFVQFTSEAAASAAIREMDGLFLDGRSIRVQYAHKG